MEENIFFSDSLLNDTWCINVTFFFLLPVYKDGDLNYPIVEERVWERNAFHYDNVAKAMLTLFVVSTFEGIDVLGFYV